MRKICSILLLCTFGVIASPKEDIYRMVLMSLYQTELEYSYTKIYSGLETALSEHKWYQEYVVISDYSEMPAQGVSSDSFGKESAPYRQYIDTLCEFDESVGVYVAHAKYSSADKGINIIKEGNDVWYFNRNLKGQQMQSVKMLWRLCRKYNYDKDKMLYMMRAFVMAAADRNICNFLERTYDINQLYDFLKIDNDTQKTYLDLTDGAEHPFCNLQNSGVCFARYKATGEDDYLIYYDGSIIHYSPDMLRYQFAFVRKAFLLYSQKSITEKQLISFLENIMSR